MLGKLLPSKHNSKNTQLYMTFFSLFSTHFCRSTWAQRTSSKLFSSSLSSLFMERRIWDFIFLHDDTCITNEISSRYKGSLAMHLGCFAMQYPRLVKQGFHRYRLFLTHEVVQASLQRCSFTDLDGSREPRKMGRWDAQTMMQLLGNVKMVWSSRSFTKEERGKNGQVPSAKDRLPFQCKGTGCLP